MAQRISQKKRIAGPRIQIHYPPLTGEGRLRVWEKVRGMWKDRKPDPIKELKKMRKEWERDLPWPRRK